MGLPLRLGAVAVPLSVSEGSFSKEIELYFLDHWHCSAYIYSMQSFEIFPFNYYSNFLFKMVIYRIFCVIFLPLLLLLFFSPCTDNINISKAWSEEDVNQQWAAADANAQPGWEGSDPGGALSLGNALQSLPMGETEAAEAAAVDTEGLPSYRASSRNGKAYGAAAMAMPTPPPMRSLEDLSPQEAALQEFLMNEAVDAGMWLHHARLENSHSTYATSIRFGAILEDVESEDVRRGAVPLVPGTGMKMPTWIRASEEIMPQMEALNAAQAQLEIEANEAETQRVKDSIFEEVAAAQELLAVTDPFAGVSLPDPTAAPEALDELFGDPDTLLPGAGGSMFSSDLLEDMVGESALREVEQYTNDLSLTGAALNSIVNELKLDLDDDFGAVVEERVRDVVVVSRDEDDIVEVFEEEEAGDVRR